MEGKFSKELAELMMEPYRPDGALEMTFPTGARKQPPKNPYAKERENIALRDPAYFQGMLEMELNGIWNYILEEAERLGLREDFIDYVKGRQKARKDMAAGIFEAPIFFAMSWDAFCLYLRRGAREHGEPWSHEYEKRVFNDPEARLYRLWEAFNYVREEVPDIVNQKTHNQALIAMAFSSMLQLGMAIVKYQGGIQLQLTREELDKMQRDFEETTLNNKGLQRAIAAMDNEKSRRYITTPDAARIAALKLKDDGGRGAEGQRSAEAIKKVLQEQLKRKKIEPLKVSARQHYYSVVNVADILSDWRKDRLNKEEWQDALDEKAVPESDIWTKLRSRSKQ